MVISGHGLRLSGKRIGIDFDNTLVSYDEVFLETARKRRLVAEEFSGRKQAVRDAIRLLPDGETAWQRLQGYVYGTGMSSAQIFAGVVDFLRRACAEGHEVFIVSHKTEYGHYDPDQVSLRDAARKWMEDQGLFDEATGLSRENVFFESTRSEKLARIGRLGCSHFVDDLEEVLTDPDFPSRVKRILFSRDAGSFPDHDVSVCHDWNAVTKVLLDDNA